jgi:hypothetical protein
MYFSIYTSYLPAWFLFLLIFGSVVGLSCLGLLLQRTRKFEREVLTEKEMKLREVAEQDRAKVTQVGSASIGLLIAILLGLMVANTLTKFSTADMTVVNEASAIMAAARNSTALPEPLRSDVQRRLILYCQQVLSGDWSIMSVGHQDTQKPLPASGTLSKLWIDDGKSIVQAPIGDKLLDNLSEINNQRAQRFAISREGLPDSLWLLFAAGTVLLVYLGILERLSSTKEHMRMIIILSAPMGIFLWLLAELDNPFGGSFPVSPSPFQHALQVLHALAH